MTSDWVVDLCAGQGSIALGAIANWRNAVYVEKDFAQLTYFRRRIEQIFRPSLLAQKNPVWVPKSCILKHNDDNNAVILDKMTDMECRYTVDDFFFHKLEPTVPLSLPWGAEGLQVGDVERFMKAMQRGYRDFEPYRVSMTG